MNCQATKLHCEKHLLTVMALGKACRTVEPRSPIAICSPSRVVV